MFSTVSKFTQSFEKITFFPRDKWRGNICNKSRTIKDNISSNVFSSSDQKNKTNCISVCLYIYLLNIFTPLEEKSGDYSVIQYLDSVHYTHQSATRDR